MSLGLGSELGLRSEPGLGLGLVLERSLELWLEPGLDIELGTRMEVGLGVHLWLGGRRWV